LSHYRDVTSNRSFPMIACYLKHRKDTTCQRVIMMFLFSNNRCYRLVLVRKRCS